MKIYLQVAGLIACLAAGLCPKKYDYVETILAYFGGIFIGMALLYPS